MTTSFCLTLGYLGLFVLPTFGLVALGVLLTSRTIKYKGFPDEEGNYTPDIVVAVWLANGLSFVAISCLFDDFPPSCDPFQLFLTAVLMLGAAIVNTIALIQGLIPK